MYTMYTDVFLIEVMRLSLTQNTDECVGDVVCVYNWRTWLEETGF